MLSTNVTVTFQQAPPPPTADFTWGQQAASLTVDFTDASTGGPTSWAWDFGDSGSSNQQNPSHTFAAAGNYNVKLTATNAGGSDSTTKQVTVSAVSGGTVYAADAFSRTVSNGWGSADVGGSYTLLGTAANFSVGAASAPSSIRRPERCARRPCPTLRAPTSTSPSAFASTRSPLVPRTSSMPPPDKRHERVPAAHPAQRQRQRVCQASVVVNGTESALGNAVVVPGLTQSANGWIRFRAQVTGASPTTIRVKAWADGSAEPSAWNFTATSSTPASKERARLACVSTWATPQPPRRSHLQ
jgi:PKD repeat protein